MHRRVLLVGQCSMDFSSIRRLLQTHFSVVVDAADTLPTTLNEAQTKPYDLILVNRLLDLDGTAGLEVVRALIEHPQTRAIPVMLVSNFPAAQQEAIEAGAIPGFGKQHLHDPETLERLRPLLS
jgi:CheY-like chemotaxis protein